MKQFILTALLIIPVWITAQKETKLPSSIEKVTVFKFGAQVEHSKEATLAVGKQVVVFEKLTDFVDPNSIQLKCSQNAVILSVRTRKNYDDAAMAKEDVTALNGKKKSLERDETKLRDEYHILLRDEELLLLNNRLGSQNEGVKVSELKEASAFFHSKLMEIENRKTVLEDEIEVLIRKSNAIEQEITTRRSLPVKNYTEIEVELDVTTAGKTAFDFTYITDKASWKPYYDMRSNGIGSAVQLEAKGLVTQNTGIDWTNVNLVLSTNDPYDNTQEPIIEPWNIDYYTTVPRKLISERIVPAYDFSGNEIHGEVIDARSGEPLAFAKISMNNNPLEIYKTDATGRFSFVVPRNETGYSVQYLGYTNQYVNITAPFTKIMLIPEDIALEDLKQLEQANYAWTGNGDGAGNGASMNYELDEVQISANSRYSSDAVTTISRKDIARMPSKRKASATASTVAGTYSQNFTLAQTVEKDLRMEFQINQPFSIPSDDADHRVAIAVYNMNANYEYHSVPKLDESVYLVAQISGWEKLNLLSGESNLYFDGTFIGKNYIDVNSSKDTLSFSLGKDKKMVVERKRSETMSKTRLIGNRYKYEVTWDFTIRNNGAGAIPLILKDHFPISINNDIKVKQGNYLGAELDEKTGILTWRFPLAKGETKKISFDYSVDYGKGEVIYLE